MSFRLSAWTAETHTGISEGPGHRSSEAIGCTCAVLPQLAAVSQLGGYIRGLQSPCSDGAVFSESQHHQLACCVFFLDEDLG